MVANITARDSIGKTIGYNHKKVLDKHASIILTSQISPEASMQEIEQQFKDLMGFNPRIKKPVFHVSLNPHPEDKLSEEQLIAIAQEYMEKMGYGNQPYVVYKHNDIDREHIHIVSLRVDTDGNKINDQFERRRSKRITDELERKYQLIPSTPEKKEVEKQKEQPEKDGVYNSILKALEQAVAEYKFTTLGEMNCILERFNIQAQTSSREVRGRSIVSHSYFPIDEHGKVIGRGIKSSELPKEYRTKALSNLMEIRRKEEPKSSLYPLRSKIERILGQSRSIDEFAQKLKLANIELILRKTEDGRIYGTTFIDEENKRVINGSRISDSLSAHRMEKFRLNPIDRSRYMSTNSTSEFEYSNRDSDTPYTQHQDKQAQEWHNQTQGESITSEITGMVGDIIEEVLETPHIDISDIKEQAWQRKLKRRKGRRKL